jgi:tRNA-specific 2-thiouridylase
MPSSSRIVVAMSGGVDSSVAAALLVQAGCEVVGLSMQLYDQRDGREAFGRCCTLDDLHDARRVAAALGIPHYIVNFEDRFRQTVVRNFVDEYARGRTPIPCVHCNADLKFATLVERAAGLEADAVATGHYARVEFDGATRRHRLLRARDATKDQTYFLFSLTQDQLARARFPVGHLVKADVRKEAARLGLAVAAKPDSHEICFVPDGHAAEFVERQLGNLGGGDIVDSGGRVLSKHAGIHRFTVGQRKGLGVAAGTPLYVLRLDARTREVVVGPRTELGRTHCTASTVNWIAGVRPPGPIRGTARIRHRHQDAPATIVADERGAHASITFDVPQPAVTPGQAVVFYDGEEVLGGGWID